MKRNARSCNSAYTACNSITMQNIRVELAFPLYLLLKRFLKCVTEMKVFPFVIPEQDIRYYVREFIMAFQLIIVVP
jgi:hypothetical protein